MAALQSDVNFDSTVNESDTIGFFSKWLNGEPGADMNMDGRIDGEDLARFLEAYESP
jgi:hypothetical protein